MIEINEAGDKVFYEGLVIKLKQNIDYIPTAEDKVTVGRVDDFKVVYNDPFEPTHVVSIWMKITEIENPKNKNWISIPLWKQMYDSGIFQNNKPMEEAQPMIHASTELSDDDLPF